jgi:hypothetical protein
MPYVLVNFRHEVACFTGRRKLAEVAVGLFALPFILIRLQRMSMKFRNFRRGVLAEVGKRIGDERRGRRNCDLRCAEVEFAPSAPTAHRRIGGQEVA